MDGEAETRRFLFIASSAIREACSGVFHDPSCRHDYGLLERILRPSIGAGLLCGAIVSDGTGYYYEDDIAGIEILLWSSKFF